MLRPVGQPRPAPAPPALRLSAHLILSSTPPTAPISFAAKWTTRPLTLIPLPGPRRPRPTAPPLVRTSTCPQSPSRRNRLTPTLLPSQPSSLSPTSPAWATPLPSTTRVSKPPKARNTRSHPSPSSTRISMPNRPHSNPTSSNVKSPSATMAANASARTFRTTSCTPRSRLLSGLAAKTQS